MAKKKSAFVQEFKEFISRGNVVDMAVGIIIGTAFTAIVTSLVNDVIMPLSLIHISAVKPIIARKHVGYGTDDSEEHKTCSAK